MVDRLGLVHKITVTGFNFGGNIYMTLHLSTTKILSIENDIDVNPNTVWHT